MRGCRKPYDPLHYLAGSAVQRAETDRRNEAILTETVIIGGGMSGMAAAITAARRGDRVTVLERERRPLRKLAAAGNGRGNLLNERAARYSGNPAFAAKVLEKVTAEDVRAFWESIGVMPVHESEGRVYPSTFLAASAVEALNLEAELLGIRILCCMTVQDIRPDGKRFILSGTKQLYAPETPRKNGKAKPGALLSEESFSLKADRVILCCGGAAAPQYGTDGSAYTLLTALGHTLIEPKPALCAICTENTPPEEMTGLRLRAVLRLTDTAENRIGESSGEILFAQDGISGIAAMDLSGKAQSGYTLHLDLRNAVTGQPDMERADLPAWLAERRKRLAERPARDLLTGCASPALSSVLLRMSSIAPEKPCRTIDGEALSRMASLICDTPLTVSGTRDFTQAQVTAGGIDPADIDAETMESRLCRGLHVCGEILDVDGPCGGYNLMFAAACGILAGKAVSRKASQKQ